MKIPFGRGRLDGAAGVRKAVARSGISKPRCFEFNSREGVLSAVAAGMGISAIFDEGLLPEDRIVRLPIRGCNIRSNIEVACLKERRNSAPIRAFLDIARELVA